MNKNETTLPSAQFSPSSLSLYSFIVLLFFFFVQPAFPSFLLIVFVTGWRKSLLPNLWTLHEPVHQTHLWRHTFHLIAPSSFFLKTRFKIEFPSSFFFWVLENQIFISWLTIDFVSFFSPPGQCSKLSVCYVISPSPVSNVLPALRNRIVFLTCSSMSSIYMGVFLVSRVGANSWYHATRTLSDIPIQGIKKTNILWCNML